MLSLQTPLDVPLSKVPISITSFVSYIIPPVVSYFGTAVLAVTPQTRALRVALCPIVAVLAVRAALIVDCSLGDPELKSHNFNFVSTMMVIATQPLSWTFTEKPFVRILRPMNGSPTILDALDFATNVRGIGWEWSRGMYVPPETRPTKRIHFALHALLSALSYGFVFDVLQEALKTFVTNVGTTSQGSIVFDESLPFLPRYIRASIITILTGMATYTGMQSAYDILTVPSVLFFRQDLARWPPLFDNPWGATSLTEFWGRRWHQYYRRTFLLFAYPLSAALGRPGTVIGAFLTSALIHHLIILPLDDRAQAWRMFFGFGMMAPGVLAERAFLRLTGEKVGGTVGWVWTMTWLLLWGTLITDGLLGTGMFTFPNAAGNEWLVRIWVKQSVLDFDTWLRRN